MSIYLKELNAKKKYTALDNEKQHILEITLTNDLLKIHALDGNEHYCFFLFYVAGS